ncbi:unnamed protein product [Linum tenue]|uniref:TOX high mobility group box family member 4-A n=2 Tax=Linum tenue TaxID=586396 RepID=A0AAV0MZY7_9ROSI|nr:unnamed protein product [Linum tenue]
MEDLSSMWSYQESMDEVKQSLLYKTLELESFKSEANAKLSKCREEMTQLIDLLKLAYQERDDAKAQLQKLLHKIIPSEMNPILQPDSPIVVQGKANSSITESNSLSETYNPQYSHSSSPVDSFFHDAAAVTSPEFSSINMAAAAAVSPVVAVKIDPIDAVIDELVKGKALPQQGRLLQTVMEAGPLLNTLLVAGPLPRWRNPPKLQTFKIPPVSIKGCDGSSKIQAVPLLQQKMTLLGSQTCSASMVNFASSGWSLSAGGVGQIQPGKRQRFQ